MSIRALLSAAFILGLTAATPHLAAAQAAAPAAIEVVAAGQLQELALKDGTRAIGRVESIDGERVTFRTQGGVTMTVERSQITSVTIAHGRMVSSDFWFEDPNPTRLFFAPTARSLRKGESYFGVYEIFLPFVQVGITDRFSIGGGTPLILGSGDRPFWLTPKLQVMSSSKIDVAIGTMHFTGIGDFNGGIAYGVATSGTRDDAFTVGLGYAYNGTEVGASVIMLGGEHRISRRTKLVTENYITTHGHGFISGGIRLMGDRLSTDLQFVTPLGADTFLALPMINFVWKSK